MASLWLRSSCPSLLLFFNRTYPTTSYVTNHEVETITVTLTDNNKVKGLVGRIFNISTGTLTLTHTVANPTTQYSTFLTNITQPSTSVALILMLGE